MHSRSPVTASSTTIILALCFAAIITASILSHAGPLDPPAGPITPSYKTLSDVEPRTAINASNTPGDAGTVFLITKPGSYYLTQNVQLPVGKAGVATTASDVTIDLNGFTITGSASSSQGVVSYGGAARVTVRNGRVLNVPFSAVSVGGADSVVEDIVASSISSSNEIIFTGDRSTVRRCQVQGGGVAITCGSSSTIDQVVGSGVSLGVNASGKSDITIRDCRFLGTAGVGTGINAGDRLIARRVQLDKFIIGIQATSTATIEGCLLTGAALGIVAGSTARIHDTTVSGMSSTGVQAGDFSRLTSCTILATTGVGVSVGSDCTLISVNISACGGAFSGVNRNTLVDCSASKCSSGGTGFAFTDGNTFTNCRSDENPGDGFNARFGNVWADCSARSNSGDGIESSSGGFIRHCRIDGSGSGAGIGANIRLAGDASRVQDNSLIGGDFGIQTTGGGNTIHRNSSRNSANHYGGIAGGNDVGPIGTSATATSPWANIAY